MKRTMRDEAVYDELSTEDLEEYFIYFTKLPIGNVIKVGHSQIANGNFHKRQAEEQRYFVEDIEILGIERIGLRNEARRQETHLLDTFGRARPKSELVYDDKRVRDYIQEHCDGDIGFFVEMSHIAELRRNRERNRM